MRVVQIILVKHTSVSVLAYTSRISHSPGIDKKIYIYLFISTKQPKVLLRYKLLTEALL